MNTSCKIIIEFDNNKKIQNIVKSIDVDNFNFVKTKINGNKLEADIKSNSVSSLLHTLDDLLACISVAEKIVE